MKTKSQPQSELIKSGRLLADFVEYCAEHPTERFWQALCNWCGADFVFKGMMNSTYGGERVVFDTLPVYLKNTFNEE